MRHYLVALFLGLSPILATAEDIELGVFGHNDCTYVEAYEIYTGWAIAKNDYDEPICVFALPNHRSIKVPSIIINRSLVKLRPVVSYKPLKKTAKKWQYFSKYVSVDAEITVELYWYRDDAECSSNPETECLPPSKGELVIKTPKKSRTIIVLQPGPG